MPECFAYPGQPGRVPYRMPPKTLICKQAPKIARITIWRNIIRYRPQFHHGETQLRESDSNRAVDETSSPAPGVNISILPFEFKISLPGT